MAKATLNQTERFFFEHAGFSYNPKTETKAQGKRNTAIALAKAEEYAYLRNWSFDWPWEESPDLSWMDDEQQAQEHEVLCCVLRDSDGNVLESLGNIVDADRNYARVVQAELAYEAMRNELDNFVC